MSLSKSAQLETAPTKRGSESVYLFLEFTMIVKGLLAQSDLYQSQRIRGQLENKGGITDATEIESDTFHFS